MDVSLLFSLRWAASCCEDVTFIVKAFWEQGEGTTNYIDNFGGVAMDEKITMQHFSILCGLLKCLGLKEVLHKASTPA